MYVCEVMWLLMYCKVDIAGTDGKFQGLTVHTWLFVWQFCNSNIVYMLRTDCKLDQFVNGPPVYKPVFHFLHWLARFQLYKATLYHL